MTFELYVPFEMMRMLSLMQRYSHFRGLDQLEAPLVVLEPGGNGDPPPPPPPVGIAEVLAAQTEILRQLVQAQQQPRGGHHAHQAQEASYKDFLST